MRAVWRGLKLVFLMSDRATILATNINKIRKLLRSRPHYKLDYFRESSKRGSTDQKFDSAAKLGIITYTQIGEFTLPVPIAERSST